MLKRFKEWFEKKFGFSVSIKNSAVITKSKPDLRVNRNIKF